MPQKRHGGAANRQLRPLVPWPKASSPTKRPETDEQKRHALAFLQRDADAIHKLLERGESAWVHCTEGINRGPSGVMAYLLLYTDATLEDAQDAVGSVRSRANVKKNTFLEQLRVIAARQKVFPRPHASVEIRDGGGGSR